nr:MAG TPA: tail completion protein [Caudoviricetes sp.]
MEIMDYLRRLESMVEKIIKDYLQSNLGIPVRLEEDDNLEEEYVLIEKTGSGEEEHISKATIAIQSYSASLFGAATLNERVKETMRKIIELDNICRCDLNTDYNYTDTARKRYRYQAVYDIVHY